MKSTERKVGFIDAKTRTGADWIGKCLFLHTTKQKQDETDKLIYYAVQSLMDLVSAFWKTASDTIFIWFIKYEDVTKTNNDQLIN